jgi:hypothetical protein
VQVSLKEAGRVHLIHIDGWLQRPISRPRDKLTFSFLRFPMKRPLFFANQALREHLNRATHRSYES